MFKLQTPADFYTYLLCEIINEEFLFNSPYSPELDLVYGKNFSIYEHRKKMREYCIQFYKPEYIENQWKFFPLVFQFIDLDTTQKDNEEFYHEGIENDAQLQADYLKRVIHGLMLPDFRKTLKKSKDEILNHYLEGNQQELNNTFKAIENNIQNEFKVLHFLKNALENYQSNSHLHEVILLQQHHLIHLFFAYNKSYIMSLQHYMKTYCEEELQLFEETLLKYTEEPSYLINA